MKLQIYIYIFIVSMVLSAKLHYLFCCSSHFLAIKVGTAVVTRNDGRLALGRLGALCEQVHKSYYRIIMSLRAYSSILIDQRCTSIGLNCIFHWNLQVKELNSRGFEVILVTSGAVGVGRQRLRYRKLVHSRFIQLLFSYFISNFFYWVQKHLLYVSIDITIINSYFPYRQLQTHVHVHTQ